MQIDKHGKGNCKSLQQKLKTEERREGQERARWMDRRTHTQLLRFLQTVTSCTDQDELFHTDSTYNQNMFCKLLPKEDRIFNFSPFMKLTPLLIGRQFTNGSNATE
jgi:hypothetical protein